MSNIHTLLRTLLIIIGLTCQITLLLASESTQNDSKLYLKIDTAHTFDHSRTILKFKQAISGCQVSSLDIYYAFGQARIMTQSYGGECRLIINLQGELDESGKGQTFSCKSNIFESLDWLKSEADTRQDPPLYEIKRSPHCSHLP